MPLADYELVGKHRKRAGGIAAIEAGAHRMLVRAPETGAVDDQGSSKGQGEKGKQNPVRDRPEQRKNTEKCQREKEAEESEERPEGAPDLLDPERDPGQRQLALKASCRRTMRSTGAQAGSCPPYAPSLALPPVSEPFPVDSSHSGKLSRASISAYVGRARMMAN